ncbi:hypothetical protein JR316_0011535 [Psilocybe cubensis]|uniref:Uncharacterized protein n=1 Tax=Psilocybe cubensis TaxID=181762 RepID=A0ACB8GLR6_PSICU|nr:hypothetical protein JR316_0011535 [Psilocybe cubensis]KAH9475970.1 hypothetical protein JR316_0011535 [Psilocybe cubensis]
MPPIDSATEIPEERYDVDHDYSKKSDKGNVVPKARFARRRTHNEQLLVSCCGIINARATMFGAESVSGADDFLKSRYLIARKDNYFQHVIMPVDVFHFKSKHKVTDEFCQKHCNPAKWNELVGEDGKWIFNSSAAEQVNAWLGGYLAIVRDMLAHNYDFFLDEMIMRRNKLVLGRLLESGHVPYIVPSYDEYP